MHEYIGNCLIPLDPWVFKFNPKRKSKFYQHNLEKFRKGGDIGLLGLRFEFNHTNVIIHLDSNSGYK